MSTSKKLWNLFAQKQSTPLLQALYRRLKRASPARASRSLLLFTRHEFLANVVEGPWARYRTYMHITVRYARK